MQIGMKQLEYLLEYLPKNVSLPSTQNLLVSGLFSFRMCDLQMCCLTASVADIRYNQRRNCFQLFSLSS